MNDIFLSYASSDRNRIQPLIKILEMKGWKVFWDRNIPIGKTWRGVIEQEIKGCHCILVVWTQAAVKSEWVLEEAEEGKRRNILFPVSLDDTIPPFGFGNIQTSNLSSWNGSTKNHELKSLISELTKCINKNTSQQSKKPSSTVLSEDRVVLNLPDIGEPYISKKKIIIILSIVTSTAFLATTFYFTTNVKETTINKIVVAVSDSEDNNERQVTSKQKDDVGLLVQQRTDIIANTQEKSIAEKYISKRSYTDEHAYRDIINILLKQKKYQSLIPVKDLLYSVTHLSSPLPVGTVINSPFIRDCIRVGRSHVNLEGYTINDAIFDTAFPHDFDTAINRINQYIPPAVELKYFKHLRHRDAIQLFPSDPKISPKMSQFAGAVLKDVTIKDTTIKSKGLLTGLFFNDGAYQNLNISNFQVETNNDHQTVIQGLLSGSLDYKRKDGSAVHINLLPLRLGGGHNIYIIGFSEKSSYKYHNIKVGKFTIITDNRKKVTKRGTYYTDFDMDKFINLMMDRNTDENIFTSIKQFASKSGKLVKK